MVKGRSPLQELEEVPHNRPYLLVTFKGFTKEPSSLCYKNLADKNSNQFKNIVGPAWPSYPRFSETTPLTCGVPPSRTSKMQTLPETSNPSPRPPLSCKITFQPTPPTTTALHLVYNPFSQFISQGRTSLSVAAEPPEWSHRSWCSFLHIVRASDDPM